MTKPTFIGIGAQKCASTWIYDILADHPDVGLSTQKEIDFFSYHYDHGLQWYENKFSDVGRRTAVGEISPSYFHEPAAPERIHRHYPSVKLIVSLRNPIKRAMSNHVHEIRIGHLTGDDLSFEKGLQNNPMYVEQGLYAKHLERWFQYFEKDQILILLFEDIVGDQLESAKRIYRFLGIDQNHLPAALNNRSNRSYVNRYAGLESLRKNARSMMRRAGLDFIWKFAGKLGLSGIYRKVNQVSGESVVPEVQDETIRRLTAVFDDDISRLESILSRNLSMWR